MWLSKMGSTFSSSSDSSSSVFADWHLSWVDTIRSCFVLLLGICVLDNFLRSFLFRDVHGAEIVFAMDLSRVRGSDAGPETSWSAIWMVSFAVSCTICVCSVSWFRLEAALTSAILVKMSNTLVMRDMRVVGGGTGLCMSEHGMSDKIRVFALEEVKRSQESLRQTGAQSHN